jgi:hypothetical protein
MKTVKTFEQFVRESQGSNASNLLSKLGNDTEHETVATMMTQDEDPSDEILAAMKKLGCKAEDCVVIGDYHTNNWNKVLRTAKMSGVKFIEIEDDNGSAIVFSMNESYRLNESTAAIEQYKTILQSSLKCKLIPGYNSVDDNNPDEEFGHYIEYSCEGLEVNGEEVTIVVYENGTANFFHDASPYPMSKNTSTEARQMGQQLIPFPKPVKDFKASDLDNVVKMIEG